MMRLRMPDACHPYGISYCTIPQGLARFIGQRAIVPSVFSLPVSGYFVTTRLAGIPMVANVLLRAK
jgi:hypothetical protein